MNCARARNASSPSPSFVAVEQTTFNTGKKSDFPAGTTQRLRVAAITVMREWTKAKGWLYRELSRGAPV
jgi:hypothetical protein